MRGFSIRPIVTGTSRGQLKALNSEGQVLIIRIVDQKAVIDGLLQALGFITLRNEGTSGAGSGAFFNTSGLGQSFVVSLDVIDNNSPFAVDVDGSQRLDIASFAGAQVGFLDNFLQSVDRVIGIGQHILVHLLHAVVVVFDGLLDFVSGVFGILQTPSFGVSSGALGLMIRFRVMRSMMRHWVVGGGVMRGGMVGNGVMRNGSIRVMVGHRGIRIGMIGPGGGAVPIRSGGGGISVSVGGMHGRMGRSS